MSTSGGGVSNVPSMCEHKGSIPGVVGQVSTPQLQGGGVVHLDAVDLGSAPSDQLRILSENLDARVLLA